MVDVTENEGQVKNGHFGHKVAHDGRAGQGHVHCAKAKAFHQVALVAKLAGWINLDIDIALAAFFHKFGKMVGALSVNIVRFGNVPQLEGDRGGHGHGRAQYEGAKRHKNSANHL